MTQDDDDEATVGALLRAAGPRDMPPAALAREVRAAVEAEWHAVVAARRRERRRRYATLAMAAGVGALAIGAWWLRPQATPEAAVVAAALRVDGTVRELARAADDASGFAVAAGLPLRVGDSLATGPDGRLALEWQAGGSVRVDAGTRVELGADRLRLRAGAVYVESGADGRAPLVETPLGIVHHLGTRYEVRVAPRSVAVTVRDGRVGIQAPRRAEVVGTGGERVTVETGGGVAREAVPAYGAHWEWVESVAPPFAIEGRTLADFVAWSARESGRELRYASPEVRAAAAALVLHGSTEGLSPAAALSAVLATTRFRAQVQDGALVVAPRDDRHGALR